LSLFLRFLMCLLLTMAPFAVSVSGDGIRVNDSSAQAGRKSLVAVYLAEKVAEGATKRCANSAACVAKVEEKAVVLGKKALNNKAVQDKAAQLGKKLFPELKFGTRGGPKAGKAFGKGVKEEAFAEDSTKTCVFCQRQGTGSQVDHAYPKSLGGDAEIGNAQLACRHCNPSKGNGIVPKSPPPGYKGPWPTPRLKAFEKLVKKSRGWK
jgi:hypothetical protein